MYILGNDEIDCCLFGRCTGSSLNALTTFQGMIPAAWIIESNADGGVQLSVLGSSSHASSGTHDKIHQPDLRKKQAVRRRWSWVVASSSDDD
mmetsp:Transcript_36844/g.105878  ORF Transcript_36844/g.105878 Transcript_36844/m.105878 type:complete len:92 (+) Transcript_36844:18-293(+)